MQDEYGGGGTSTNKPSSYGSGNSSSYNAPATPPKATKFNTTNSQDDGVRKLRRIEFEFMGKAYKFALNPEEYTQSEPSRSMITQTKGGAWVDDFGAGLVTISFRGTTGWRNGAGLATSGAVTQWAGTTGFDRFKELRDMIRQYYSKAVPGDAIPNSKELVFHNYTDGEHWVVQPQTFNLMRSVARPLLYLYEVQLTCLRPADVPMLAIIDNGKLGKIVAPYNISGKYQG